MKKVDINKLDVVVEGSQYISTFEGVPFSGIAFEKLQDGSEEETYYLEGLQNGYSLLWNMDSILIREAHFLAGKLHGIMWEWFPNGTLKQESIYDFGFLVKKAQWDEEGVLISNYEIDENSDEFIGLQRIRKYRRKHS